MDIFHPLQLLADEITYRLFGLTAGSYWGEAVNFFIYDVAKIGLLMLVIGYIMAITRYYFPVEKVRDILTKRRWYGLDYLFAALLGVVTPFCSCSSIPLFVGFMGAGIPIGVTFAFLIASPLVNEASLYLFPAMFGFKITIIYNLLGITIAMLGGLLIQKLKLEMYLKISFNASKTRHQVEAEHGHSQLSLKAQAVYFWHDGLSLSRSIMGYVILGVGLGALIHGFVPADLVERYLSSKEWWTIPVATVIGSPLYANSVSIIPVMEALIGKGVPVGTALAFMTGVVTVSIPQTLILKKVMGWQALSIFIGITLIGIMTIGYVFNGLL
jgi:uncharacterized protein